MEEITIKGIFPPKAFSKVGGGTSMKYSLWALFFQNIIEHVIAETTTFSFSMSYFASPLLREVFVVPVYVHMITKNEHSLTFCTFRTYCIWHETTLAFVHSYISRALLIFLGERVCHCAYTHHRKGWKAFCVQGCHKFKYILKSFPNNVFFLEKIQQFLIYSL